MDTLNEILGGLGFNWKMALFDFVNFLILFAILNKFLFKKVIASLEQKQKDIAENEQKMQQIEEKLQQTYQESERITKAAQVEANDIIKESHKKAKTMTQEMKDKTAEELRAKADKSKQLIEREREETLGNIKKDAVDIIITSVEKIVGEKFSKEKDNALIKESLSLI